MRRIIYVALCLAAAAGLSACGTARRATSQQQSATVHEDSTQQESAAVDILKQIEASASSATEITYTEIEYYPGEQPAPSGEQRPQDPANLPAGTGCPKDTPSGLTTTAGTATGGVKSIKQVTIKHTESAGASGTTAATLQAEKEITAVRDSVGTASTESIREPDKEAVAASKSWAGAVTVIAAVAAGLLLLIFLWRSGAFSWLRAKLKK